MAIGQIDYRPTGTSEYSKYKDAIKYAPGGMEVQRMIGNSIDKTFAERRQMQMDSERRRMNKLKESIINYRAGQQMAKDMDDLNIMGDTASKDFNQILTDGSRQIADYAAFLNQELKRTGDYNTYAQEMAKLKAEVTNMKGLKGGVNNFLDAYERGINDGTLSDYNSPEILAMAEDMANGSPGGGWTNINGQQVWKGKTVTGDDYQVSASEFRNLAQRLQKKEDIDAMLAPALKVNRTAQGNILSFNQQPVGTDGKQGKSASEMSLQALDNLLGNTPGNKDRKMASLLVDHYGYTRAEADALFDPANGGTEAGKKVLQDLWLQRAENMYGINQRAVQDYWHRAEDQKFEHREEKAQALQLKRQQDETVRVFADKSTPAIWNTEMPEVNNMNSFLGLIDRYAMDLNRIGLTDQNLVFDDDTIIPQVNDKGKMESILAQKGQPTGIQVKNPLNPAGPAIFIPFNANPQEIQEAIRQANGLNVGRYATGEVDQYGRMKTSKYTSQTAGFAGYDRARTPETTGLPTFNN